MQYTAYKRATLLIPSGPGMHLYVVMNDVDSNGQHILFSITTARENKYYDKACILEPDDHDFLENKSYVYYKEPLLRHSTHITKCVGKRVFFPRTDIELDVFNCIYDGIIRSIHSSRWAKKYSLDFL